MLYDIVDDRVHPGPDQAAAADRDIDAAAATQQLIQLPTAATAESSAELVAAGQAATMHAVSAPATGAPLPAVANGERGACDDRHFRPPCRKATNL